MKKNLKQLKLKHFCKKQISSKSLTKTYHSQYFLHLLHLAKLVFLSFTLKNQSDFSYNIGYFRTASDIVSSFLSSAILNFTFLLLLLLHKNDLTCNATHVHITKIMKQV